MLTHLYIRNFALIEELAIDFPKGFIAVTGETGTGKSIVLGALKLVLGERADYSQISNLEQKSVIEAHFSIPKHILPFFEENDLDFEPQTIVRREILPQGKSRAFINDVPTHLSVLQELSSHLIDIHSQFDTSDLLQESYQLKMLDYFAENKDNRHNFNVLYKNYIAEKTELEKLKNIKQELSKNSEYNLFLLKELQDNHLDSINFVELQNQLHEWEHAEEIVALLNESYQLIADETIGTEEHIRQITQKLSKIRNFSTNYENLVERIESIYIELKDIRSELENASEKIELNPEKKQEAQQKLDKINLLFTKHNVQSIEELLHIQQQLAYETEDFSEINNNILVLEKSLEVQKNKLLVIAEKLSEKRKESAQTLANNILKTIQQLGLDNAILSIEVSDTKELNSYGKNKITLKFSANMGKEPQSIDKAISGGERSRVMLALKKIMAENEELPTLIFDEIDTGVSGRIASEIGNVMQQMSENMQLIVITHLPQVAAKATHHYKVTKEVVASKTLTKMISLTSDERITEIAHLLSGERITEAATNQAKELLQPY